MKTSGPTLAFDRSASSRRYDDDGRLHVAISNISKAVVNPYYGHEIPNHIGLGLDPDKVYRLLRDPAELEKAAPSFRNVPLQLKHVHHKANDAQQDVVIGTVGDPVYEHPYLKASLCIWVDEGIAAVETKTMVELSSSYHYDAVMEPGDFEGELYDGRMTNIRGNHVALVETGRAGSDVLVSDENPFTPRKQEIPAMKPTKLGRALMVALSAASPKIAQDSSLGALVGKAEKKTLDKNAVVAKLVAMDTEINTGALEDIIEAIMGVEDNPEPEKPTVTTGTSDSEGTSAIIDFLQSKGLDAADLEAVTGMLAKLDAAPAAMDESEVDDKAEKKADEKVKTAMDAMRREFRDLEVAKSAVRNTVGEVIGMDSAHSVYRFALDHLKVDHKGMPDAGLAQLFAVARNVSKGTPTPSIANDAATVKSVPGLERFS